MLKGEGGYSAGRDHDSHGLAKTFGGRLLVEDPRSMCFAIEISNIEPLALYTRWRDQSSTVVDLGSRGGGGAGTILI